MKLCSALQQDDSAFKVLMSPATQMLCSTSCGRLSSISGVARSISETLWKIQQKSIAGRKTVEKWRYNIMRDVTSFPHCPAKIAERN